jgi:arylsulfatase A-like enzyme
MAPRRSGSRALGARGALVGAVGGALAGALDFARAVGPAVAFLPSGRARLGLFLVALYGAAASATGALVGLVAAALARSDLGALWRNGFDGDEPRAGARVVAYGVVGVASAVAVGWAVRLFTLDALHRYHHPLLIAALVGAAAAALAIGAVTFTFAVSALLSPLIPIGPRAKMAFSAPVGVLAAGWALGLVVAAAAVAQLVSALEARPRMPHALKALNTGLWAPAILVGALALGHTAARFAARLARGGRDRLGTPTTLARRGGLLDRPGGALLAIAVAIGLPTVGAVGAAWTTVRQLDGRPFVALVVAVATAFGLALAHFGQRVGARPVVARAAIALGLPLGLLAIALTVGKSDRVRKAAIAFTGATGPLVQAIQAATDLDRDGYSSVLGGGDCDDLDPSVHPGAFDWPDDGIDQDCNGHQATLAPPPPRAWAAVPPSVPEAPNVLLITIDALRADHVGSYGYPRPTTPNLDALAREATRFANGWAHAPSTRYSVPAILTGRYPSTIAVNNDPRNHWPPEVLKENRLISEILKDYGYYTAAFLSYYYFEPGWGLNQGFDEYDYHLKVLHSQGGNPAATRGSSAHELADLDVAFIEKHKNEKFFLWTHYYDTHYMFERHNEPETHFGDNEIDLYDGEIRFTDIQLGRVFDALKAAGLWDKTIILVTADHGDGFGEHGIPKDRRHGYHLYANETKVPFLIRVPGVAPGVVEVPAAHVDLIPTLLNALRRPASDEPQLLGDSLLQFMLGDQPTLNRRVYQEVWYEGPTSKKAIVDRGWHLIRNLVPDDTTELYDLRSDGAEEHDRAGDGEAAEAELRGALAAWMDEAALPRDFRARVEGNISPSAPLPSQRQLGDDVGGLVSVEGVDAPASARAGGTLELAVVLRGLGKIPEGWRLFTHVVGADGRMINADHDPVEGLFPLSRLRPGMWLRDRIKVQLPPGWRAGPTTVELGLWRASGRAKVRGPDAAPGDAVRVATVTVER